MGVCMIGCAKKTLKTIKIPNRIIIHGTSYPVTKIAKNTFRDMQDLERVIIGKNVRRIGKRAFYNCPELKFIIIKSKKLSGIGKQAFAKICVKAKANVPNKKVKKYKKMLLAAGLSSHAKVY